MYSDKGALHLNNCRYKHWMLKPGGYSHLHSQRFVEDEKIKVDLKLTTVAVLNTTVGDTITATQKLFREMRNHYDHGN